MTSKGKKESSTEVHIPKSLQGATDDMLSPKIVNPVLVSVGKVIKPHQTPIFQWQLEREAAKGKNLLRQDTPEYPLNHTGKKTKLLASMYDYNIVPGEKLKKRMDFFYTPYNSKFQMRKHMTFEDDRDDYLLMSPKEAANYMRSLNGGNNVIGSVDLSLQSPRHNEDMDRMTNAVKSPSATLEPKVADGEATIPEKVEKAQSARSKSQRSQGAETPKQLTEKREWIGLKDLIFQTDDKVLEYLEFHGA